LDIVEYLSWLIRAMIYPIDPRNFLSNCLSIYILFPAVPALSAVLLDRTSLHVLLINGARCCYRRSPGQRLPRRLGAARRRLRAVRRQHPSLAPPLPDIGGVRGGEEKEVGGGVAGPGLAEAPARGPSPQWHRLPSIAPDIGGVGGSAAAGKMEEAHGKKIQFLKKKKPLVRLLQLHAPESEESRSGNNMRSRPERCVREWTLTESGDKMRIHPRRCAREWTRQGV
jgi:hypothetical protein